MSEQKLSRIPPFIGVFFAILVQTLGIVWYAGQLDAQVTEQTQDIAELKENRAITLTRDQLNDILSGRDERISNIEKAVTRIETKLDRVIK